MDDGKKIVKFRLLAILLLLIPLGFSIWFLILFISNNPANFGIHIFTVCVMIFFILLQIFLFAKNMKKQVILYDIAFNENKSVNNTALIFMLVAETLAVALTLAMSVVYFFQTELQNQMTILLLLSIFIFMLINCTIYLLYVPIFKQKPFDVRDLLK